MRDMFDLTNDIKGTVFHSVSNFADWIYYILKFSEITRKGQTNVYY